MKKFLCTMLILAVAFSAGACAFASAAASTAAPAETVSSETQASAAAPVQELATAVVETAQPVATEEPVSTPEVTVAPVAETAADDTVVTTISGGGYVVDVLGASVVKDGQGNDAIGIKFRYTNNNSEPMSFVFISIDTVRQAGRTLTMDGMFPNSNDPTQTAWVQPVSNGQSVDVTFIYPYYSSDDIDFTLELVKDLNSTVDLASGSCTLTLN